MPSHFRLSSLPSLLSTAAGQFTENFPFRLAAALSYNAVLSLPPLLLIVVTAAGMFLGQEAVQGQVFAQLNGIVSAETAEAIQGFITKFNQQRQGGVSAALGIGTLVFTATTFFVTLQECLNTIWNLRVKTNGNTGALKQFLRDRVLSFGLILSIALLLLISFVISALLSFFTGYLERIMPGITVLLLRLIDFVLSFGITTVLFALIYRFLPDAIIRWRDVWVGAAVTATLFILGKYLLTFYIANADPGSAFGAAGSLIVLLVWIYYSSLIIFFGAELTQQYADCYGAHVVPKAHAVRIEIREVPTGESQEEQKTGRPHAEGRWRK